MIELLPLHWKFCFRISALQYRLCKKLMGIWSMGLYEPNVGLDTGGD